MVWIGSALCEKFRQDIVARTFALVAPVWRVLQHVLCSSETVPNAPNQKRNAPKQEFRVQWCGSLAFVAQNSGVTSWHKLFRVRTFCYEFGKETKWSQMVRNTPKYEFRFQWGESGKTTTRLRGPSFALVRNVLP